MKKLLFVGMALFGVLNLNAQGIKSMPIHPQDTKIGGILPKQRIHTKNGDVISKRRETISGQYNFVTSYGETWMIGDPSSYVRWITEDTNAITMYTDGNSGRSYVHTIGSSFDPKDSAYEVTGQPVLTRFNPYTVDTLRWLQFYVRQVDSVEVESEMQEVVDTVYVQYFNFTSMDFAGLQGITDFFGYPKRDNYDPKTLLNSSALATDTILFRTGDGDSVDYAGGSLFSSLTGTVPPDAVRSLSTNTNELRANNVCFSITFKPMIKAQLNDTFVNWNGPNYKGKINGYGVRAHYWTDLAIRAISTRRYNNTFWVPSFLRDGSTSNGWKSYISTSAYNTTTLLGYWLDITTENASIEELNGLNTLKVYPNPATMDNQVWVAFDLNQKSMVDAQIMNLNGQILANVDARELNAGANELALPTQSLKPGVYMVQVNSAIGTQTTKFILK